MLVLPILRPPARRLTNWITRACTCVASPGARSLAGSRSLRVPLTLSGAVPKALAQAVVALATVVDEISTTSLQTTRVSPSTASTRSQWSHPALSLKYQWKILFIYQTSRRTSQPQAPVPRAVRLTRSRTEEQSCRQTPGSGKRAGAQPRQTLDLPCLLYTSDAADE